MRLINSNNNATTEKIAK
jgi:hypothetical protein